MISGCEWFHRATSYACTDGVFEPSLACAEAPSRVVATPISPLRLSLRELRGWEEVCEVLLSIAFVRNDGGEHPASLLLAS